MALFTQTTTGNSSDSATWGGAGVPGPGDLIQTTSPYILTVDSNLTIGDGVNSANVAAGSQMIVASAVVLSLNGTVTQGGDVTQNAGSNVTFTGNFNINQDVATSPRWTINGVAGMRATLQASATFGFSIQCGTTRKADVIASYANIYRFGRANSAGNHALEIGSHGQASRIEFTNCIFDTYWRMRFGPGWTPSVTATFTFTNCDFRNPQYTDIFEYTCAADFNANTRGCFNCTFVGNATNKRFYVGNAGTSWTNKFIVTGVGQDVWWNNLLGAPVYWDTVSRYNLYTGSDTDMYNATAGNGQWEVADFVCVAVRANAHIVSSSGGTVSGGIVRDSITFGSGSADNHYLFAAGVTYKNNISVGGNGVGSTGGSGTVLVDRHTHIHKAGNFDAALIQETANFSGNSITFRNSLVVGIGDPGEVGVRVLTAADQDYAYLDFNCFYQIADPYLKCTVQGGTLTEGVDTGFGANDITDNPMMTNVNATVATWDSSLGGAGTVDNAYAEMLKLNGFDASGSPATFNANYTKANFLTYVRANLAPTNAALQGTGLGGVDRGALDVAANDRIYSKFGIAVGVK